LSVFDKREPNRGSSRWVLRGVGPFLSIVFEKPGKLNDALLDVFY